MYAPGATPGTDADLVVAVVAGVLQGVFEWLPISSEGNLTIALTALGYGEAAAVQFTLFLHAGTALSAALYYRGELRELLVAAPSWRPDGAFEGEAATVTFLVAATLASGVVGLLAYALLMSAVSELSGGAFVAAIGVALLATGVVQRSTDRSGIVRRETPTLLDALLVGGLQELAVLPGVSRSGTTVSALLLRGYEGEASFRLSFLLSVPAALGAGTLVLADAGGLPAVAPTTAAPSLAVAAVVGYLTIDALLRVVERVPFPAVCVGLGLLAVAGGAFVVLVG